MRDFGDQLVDARGGDVERFFDQHVAAGPRRGDRVIGMAARRAADHRDLERLVRQQRVQRGERGRTVSIGHQPRLLAIVAIDAGDPQARRDRGPGVRVADVPGADQPNVHTVNPSCAR